MKKRRFWVIICCGLTAFLLFSVGFVAFFHHFFSEYFLDKGVDEKNHARALWDFSLAIALDHQNATAYSDRAVVRESYDIDDLAGALFDYQKVLYINPDDDPSRISIIRIECEQRDYQSALDDANVMLRRKPGDVFAMHYRGLAREGLLDYQGALDDLRKSSDRDKKPTQLDLIDLVDLGDLATAEYLAGDEQDALDDFHIIMEVVPKNENERNGPIKMCQDTACIIIWIIESAHLQLKAKADEHLLAYFEEGADTFHYWPNQYIDYLVGKTNQDTVLPDDRSGVGLPQVYFLVGIRNALSGDRATAIQYLQKELHQSSQYDSDDIIFVAQYWLRRLQNPPS